MNLRNIFKKREDFYCPYCTSCGETGCCSPVICVNHPKGLYCDTNNDELKVCYWTLKDFWDVYLEEEMKKDDYVEIKLLSKKEIFEEIYNKLSDIYYKHLDEQRELISTPPITLFDKIKNKLKLGKLNLF